MELADLLADIDVDRLSEDEVRDLLKEAEAAAQAEKYGKFYTYFPDTGPLRRELYPKHLEFFRAGKTHTERLLLAANRVGKAQPIDEPVLTPSGFVPIGSLKVGDHVIGSGGKATKVVGVFPQGRRRVVRLTASDGSSTRCDLLHLWSVRPVKAGRASPYETMTALDLKRRLGERWMLPERPLSQLEGNDLPVDPYLLGLLLGDGGMTGNSVFITSVDAPIIHYCCDQAVAYGCVLRKAGPQTFMFSTTERREGRHFNLLVQLLQGLGVMGKGAHDKRIPAAYLLADADDRIAILRGLMDTDGCCSASNGARQFYSVSKELCEGVATIARSLGMNARVLPKNGQYQGKPHGSWLTHIAASPESIFSLQRKRVNERFAGRRMRGLMVESIEPEGEADCVCIKVEAADHLYVTADFLVTHNSECGAYEGACHLTGEYPHWWPGRVWSRPVRMWAAGDYNETTRDVIQKKLLGGVEWHGDKKGVDGSGMIPRDLIIQETITWKAGVPDLVDTVRIKHRLGAQSTLGLKSYQQGRRSFQGTEQDIIWCDEEPPMEVYNEMLIRLMTTGGMAMLTFTPLQGWTEVVESFYSDKRAAH